jgi:hypothetical protein
MSIKGCWHVADAGRLRYNLGNGISDLYPLNGQAQSWFDNRMGFAMGDRLQFCCKGVVLAEGTIAGRPRERTSSDLPVTHKGFPSVVSIKEVVWLSPPRTCKHPPRQGSHRLADP